MGSLAPQPQPSPEPGSWSVNRNSLWNTSADQPDQRAFGDQDLNLVTDGLQRLGPPTQLKLLAEPDDLPGLAKTPEARFENLPATSREESRFGLLAEEQDDGRPQERDKSILSGDAPELEIEQQLQGLIADPRYPKDPHFADYSHEAVQASLSRHSRTRCFGPDLG